jgi:hypothetical protein
MDRCLFRQVNCDTTIEGETVSKAADWCTATKDPSQLTSFHDCVPTTSYQLWRSPPKDTPIRRKTVDKKRSMLTPRKKRPPTL